jgi:hypothetical protein
LHQPPSYCPDNLLENERLEVAVCTIHVPKWEKIVCFQETALLANMFDSNPEPKSFHETTQTQKSTNWWVAMTTELQNMEQKKVWEALQSLQTQTLLERNRFTPKREMDNSEEDVLLKALARFQEKTFNRIMHQLYQTQQYTYS